ncbi:hypothetical protein PCLA_22r0041 [Pseudomonas citronellolis]|nr:hypothetical protein PCLA_22r0041 [Pseudomonas citronellolis]
MDFRGGLARAGVAALEGAALRNTCHACRGRSPGCRLARSRPSHAWRTVAGWSAAGARPAVGYRCGGSAGLPPASRYLERKRAHLTNNATAGQVGPTRNLSVRRPFSLRPVTSMAAPRLCPEAFRRLRQSHSARCEPRPESSGQQSAMRRRAGVPAGFCRSFLVFRGGGKLCRILIGPPSGHLLAS